MSFEPPEQALGVCYYPEHWPEKIWARDAEQMVATGLRWVRIGEFAWSRLEPAPGQFDWGWLDRAIAVLGGAGLKIILGTPTAAPPRWMIDKWPDMLAVDAHGQLRKFGSRRHYCFSHAGYRHEATRITTQLGQRYGGHPDVKAWQIDNEYDCHDTALSYSAGAQRGFQNWLAAKYATIDALNAAWGNVFWSMDYARFDQIDPPCQTVTEPNPAHVLDFRRYSSDQVVAFNRAQVDALRPLTDAPLIHNFMGRIAGFDHYHVGQDLDIAGWDSYPLGSLERRSDRDDAYKNHYVRQGDPDFQAFHHDLYRGVGRGRMWVMEQQPGPVNWADYNPAPLPGMVRLWAWEAFAHGAESVCFFRWRQAPFAQEQMHAGLLRPDSEPAPALREAAILATELKSMPQIKIVQARVALIFDYSSQWAWEAHPQGKDFDYFHLVFDFYRSARKLGLSVDIIAPDCTRLGDYDLVLVPGLMSMNTALRTQLKTFEGTILAGPRCASKTAEMKIPTPMPPDFPGLDCVVKRVESLRPGVDVRLQQGGRFSRWFETVCSDQPPLELTQNGAPARVGSAKRQYIAGWPDDIALNRILKQLAVENGIETLDLPDGLRCRDTGTHRFFFNYGPIPVDFNGLTLPAAGVHWAKV